MLEFVAHQVQMCHEKVLVGSAFFSVSGTILHDGLRHVSKKVGIRHRAQATDLP